MTESSSHLVAHAPNGWGHIKPLLAIFGRMLELRFPAPFTLTFLSSGPMLPKITRELQLMPGNLGAQINILDVGAPATFLDPIPGVLPALEAIRDGKTLVCKTTGREYALPPATVVIMDPFGTFAPDVVKEAAGGASVVHWMSNPMSSFIGLFGPEDLGGYGDIGAKIVAAAQAQEKREAEVADDLFERKEGAVIDVPGCPAVYDYELHPQENIMNAPIAMFIRNIHKNMQAADGLMVVAATAFDGRAVDAGRAWLARSGQDVWAVGPLENVPPAATAPEPGAEAPQHAEEDAQILNFLDKMKQKHGERAVIFIAFGTTFYPKNPAKLEAFLDELLASGTPFLWSHASPFAKVPEELGARIDACETAFHASWVPQRAVLDHPATGWFVSHGGWNSTQEALSLRVPIVMWPFTGDQPSNAALMSITHEAAFELLSVREGLGAQQPLRTKGKEPVDFSIEGVRKETRELLVKLKGAEGERVRANAIRLGEQLDESWKEGGEARGELQRFMQRFLGSS